MSAGGTTSGFGQRIKSLWFGPAGSAASRLERDYEDINKVNLALLPLLAMGFVAALRVGWLAHATGSLLLWCVACLAVGATVGFLFGIPRSGSQLQRQESADDPPKRVTAPKNAAGNARPNTNLEEVSDWLTKIIVGLGLVNLKSIGLHIDAISRNAAASLKDIPTASDVSTATAFVVGFTVMGFLLGYLYTRLFLQGAFMRSDHGTFQQVVEAELSSRPPEPPPPSGEPSIPSSADRQSAERVLQVAPMNRPEEALAPLRQLAAEYEKVRADMPFGAARTRKMTSIAGGMRRMGLVAAPFIAQLAHSTSPGERLAAISILQMRFDPAYIDWLADRLVEEAAFPGYQAASTFLARLPVVGELERQRIKAAVAAAKQKRLDLKLDSEIERDKLVEKILSY